MGKKKAKEQPQQVGSLPSKEIYGELPEVASSDRPHTEQADATELAAKVVRNHYYVKIAVSTFLCALLLLIGVPVFMESRVTGSLSYTALGVVLVAFGLILALAVVVLLFRPPFRK